MAIGKINIVNSSNGTNLYTRRTCSDNSELYIASKLNMLYKQAVLSRSYDSRKNLRKMVEGNHLDRIV